MPESRIEIKPIRLALGNAAHDADDYASLIARFKSTASRMQDAWRARYGATGAANDAAADAVALLAIVGEFLTLMPRMDGEYGADAALPLTDAADAVDEALRCLAELESWALRLDLASEVVVLQTAEIAIAYWAMRHDLPIAAPEPVVNALAEQSNRAESRQETAAAYALMQGLIHHLSPTLAADLERSNPERPWRILNLNFAITAVRTGDASMIRYAFDTLNAHLPDERAGFYQEALAVASQPGFPVETRTLIETECARWSQAH